MTRILAPVVPLPDGLRAVVATADVLQEDDRDWSLGSLIDRIGAVEQAVFVPAPMLGAVVSERGHAVISIADRLIGTRAENLVRARLMASVLTSATQDGWPAVDTVRRCNLFLAPREIVLWRAGMFLAVSRQDAEDCASGKSAIEIGSQRGVPPIYVRARVLHEILLGRLDSAESVEVVVARLMTLARTGANWLGRELLKSERPPGLRAVRSV